MSRFLTLGLIVVICLLSGAHFQPVADDSEKSATSLSDEELDEIIGGSTASITEFPFMAVLLAGMYDQPFCGGSLYNKKYIITAAHCVQDIAAYPSEVKVLLNSTTTSLNVGAYYVPVVNIKVHPNYNSATTESDVAILTLRNSVPLPCVTLPPLGSTYTYANSPATAVGWGRTTTLDQAGSMSPVLRKAAFTVMDQTTCVNRWAPSSVKISNLHLCASATATTSVCSGDSGSPILVNGVQVGIASFVAVPCVSNYLPNVFARVTALNSWIRANTP